MNVPFLVQKLFGSVTWRMPGTDPNLFLTFDDGPVPEVTPQILNILKAFDAKATFFCLGDNVRKYPIVYRQILEDGHAVGNHTYNHLNGWKTNTKKYVENVAMCADVMDKEKFNVDTNLKSHIVHRTSKHLFRPPYGRIKPSQISQLKSDYIIVMWDVLSEDYNREISGEKCFRNVADHAKPGSIVVFHDSVKAKERVVFALPKVLEHFSKQNFSFKAIGR